MVRRLRDIVDRTDRANRVVWFDRTGRATRCDTNNIVLKDSFNPSIIINNISI